MLTLSLSVCIKQKELIASLHCLYGLLIVSLATAEPVPVTIVRLMMNVKTKPALTAGRVTSRKAQTPSPLRHTSSQ